MSGQTAGRQLLFSGFVIPSMGAGTRVPANQLGHTPVPVVVGASMGAGTRVPANPEIVGVTEFACPASMGAGTRVPANPALPC